MGYQVTHWTVRSSIPGVAKKVPTTMSGLAPTFNLLSTGDKAVWARS